MWVTLRLVLLLLTLFISSGCLAKPAPANVTMEEEGSGDEFIFPVVRTTSIPPSTSPSPNITATFVRIKDFLFNQVVDFLKENLLLIIVVTSLLVVIIFIVCCASAMSHKRKLEVYYPPKTPAPPTYTTHTKPPAQRGPEKILREPSPALVGGEQELQKVEMRSSADPQKADPPPSQHPVCTCHLRKV